MKFGIYVFISFFSLVAFGQVDQVYVVTAEILNVRSGPGTSNDIVTQLKRGQEIVVTSVYNSNWYEVDYGFSRGYVYSRLITNDPDWKKQYVANGDAPNCENIVARFDNDIDNYLKVNVGSNTDVVVKLMKVNASYDQCIRISYVRSNDSYNIRNIPEGKYYLKIAYGKDWRQKVIAGQCYGKFMRSPLYEKGDQILDFNLKKNSDGYSIPSFELSLDVIASDFDNNFRTNGISEEEFNN